jgi:peptidoglycan/xylan/chitin deacetylase (PgdA/CDA1 family)
VRTTTYETPLARAGKLVGAGVARGLNVALGRRRTAGRLGILYYHRVAEVPRAGSVPPLNVIPARFREQLEGLLDRGFRFARLRDVVDDVDGGVPIPPRTVVVTFDDGYDSVFWNAWPVLEELGVPATVFVATAFLGRTEPFPFDPWALEHRSIVPGETWLPMPWERCAEMARSALVDVGTHTHTHGNFRGQPEAFADDVHTSMDVIEEHLGTRPQLFSFPYGSVRSGFAGPDLARAAASLGLRCALTTEIRLIGRDDSPMAWGRLEAGGTDSSGTLAAKLDGWYEWMGRARDLYHAVR